MPANSDPQPAYNCHVEAGVWVSYPSSRQRVQEIEKNLHLNVVANVVAHSDDSSGWLDQGFHRWGARREGLQGVYAMIRMASEIADDKGEVAGLICQRLSVV